MKKRLLIIALIAFLIVIITFLGKYTAEMMLRKPALHEDLASIIPPDSLAYIQCSQLKLRLDKFTNSNEYRTFIQSEFVGQLQQTLWWNELSYSFEEFWNSIIIDPMRIIGTDMTIGIYNAGKGERIPGIILVCKIDGIAKIAERILYVFDKLGGQIGITFEQEYQHFPVYIVNSPDMIFPLYYTIIGDIGMISTSFPLLKETINLALSSVENSIHDIPDTRFVTGYLAPSLLLDELQHHDMFWTLNGSQKDIRGKLPCMIIRLDTYLDEVVLRTEFFSDSNIPEHPDDNQEDETRYSSFQGNIPQNVPIVVARYRKKLGLFLQNWQRLFPQWEWSCPITSTNYDQGIFGEVVECRMSDTLIGTIYTIPDISCFLDTQRPEHARIFLNALIQNILEQLLSPTAQQMLVKMSSEPYRNSVISKIRFALQDMLQYTVTKNESEHPQGSYTFLTTNTEKMKQYIDLVQTQPDKQVHVLTSQQDASVFVCWLKNATVSELIREMSQTNTFSLLFPRYTHQKLYQILPFLIQILEPLPPVVLKAGVKGTGVYLELRSWRSSPEPSSESARMM